MSKINFSKTEKALAATLEKIFINNLHQLALVEEGVITTNIDPATPLNTAMQHAFVRFQNELKAFKYDNELFYRKLSLSPDEEKRLNIPAEQLVYADWLLLKELKKRLDLYINQDASNQKLIIDERNKHKTKRLNTRDGWLRLD